MIKHHSRASPRNSFSSIKCDNQAQQLLEWIDV